MEPTTIIIRNVIAALAIVGALTVADYMGHFGRWIAAGYVERRRLRAEDRRRALAQPMLLLPFRVTNIRIDKLPTLGYLIVLTEPESGLKMTAIHDPNTPERTRVELFIGPDGTKTDEEFAALLTEIADERAKMRGVRQPGEGPEEDGDPFDEEGDGL